MYLAPIEQWLRKGMPLVGESSNLASYLHMYVSGSWLRWEMWSVIVFMFIWVVYDFVYNRLRASLWIQCWSKYQLPEHILVCTYSCVGAKNFWLYILILVDFFCWLRKRAAYDYQLFWVICRIGFIKCVIKFQIVLWLVAKGLNNRTHMLIAWVLVNLQKKVNENMLENGGTA